MRFRQYCVTVMDNWTPTREFWTWRGAVCWWARHAPSSHLFVWDQGRPQSDATPSWREIALLKSTDN